MTQTKTKQDSLPLGPRTSSAIQLYQWSMRPLELLEDCAQRFGDTFTLRFAGFGTIVMFTSPEAIKEIFRGDPHTLHSGEANAFLSQIVGENSLLVLDDEPHARQRHVTMPAFKGDRMRSFFSAMRDRTLDSIAEWPESRSFRIDQSMRDITLRVILQAVLGISTGDKFESLTKQVARVLNFGATKWSLILTKVAELIRLNHLKSLPYYRQLRDLDDTLFEIIEQHRTESGTTNRSILTDLLESRHEDGNMMSNQELRDIIITSLMAGHETTATALAWSVEQILEHPNILERIRAELTSVTNGSELQAEHLPRLEYLDAVIKESLRIRTILPFVIRLVKQPFTVDGREYPSGVQLAPCVHLVHRREDLYSDAAEFHPERFLERKYSPYEWLPFGGGNRICLGMSFALFEMKVVLATVFSKVQLTRPKGAVSEIGRRGIVLSPSDGVTVIARRHENDR